MPEMYAICENKCLKDLTGANAIAVKKAECDENGVNLASKPTILCGTSEPSISEGKDGDLYAKYEEEVVG